MLDFAKNFWESQSSGRIHYRNWPGSTANIRGNPKFKSQCRGLEIWRVSKIGRRINSLAHQTALMHETETCKSEVLPASDTCFLISKSSKSAPPNRERCVSSAGRYDVTEYGGGKRCCMSWLLWVTAFETSCKAYTAGVIPTTFRKSVWASVRANVKNG